MQIVARFILGGIFVSLFAILGESFKPKSFAGIFGAAPSLALAGFVLVLLKYGPMHAAIEAHSMIFGSLALLIYSLTCSLVLAKTHLSPYLIAGFLYFEWLLGAGIFYVLVLK